MKRFLIIIITALVMLSSCGVSRYQTQRHIYDDNEVAFILHDHYPQLYTYYMNGYLRVISLKELVLLDGTLDYKLRYEFIYYPYERGTYIYYRRWPHVYYHPGPRPRPHYKPEPPHHHGPTPPPSHNHGTTPPPSHNNGPQPGHSNPGMGPGHSQPSHGGSHGPSHSGGGPSHSSGGHRR